METFYIYKFDSLVVFVKYKVDILKSLRSGEFVGLEAGNCQR